MIQDQVETVGPVYQHQLQEVQLLIVVEEVEQEKVFHLEQVDLVVVELVLYVVKTEQLIQVVVLEVVVQMVEQAVLV